MEAPRFVEAYPLTLPEGVIHPGDPSPEMFQAQEWSYRFGRLLHAQLSGTEPDTLTRTSEMDQYRQWTRGFTELELTLFETVETGPSDRMQVNFHATNRHMVDLWRPIGRGRWNSDQKREEQLVLAQNSIALEGMILYLTREGYMQDEGGTHIFSDPEYEGIYSILNGIVQEYDSAIVLLEFARKHPNLTIVPAPTQFERGPNNKRRNIDFLVVDVVDRRAVGVQVKTTARSDTVQDSDQERVVFIDGTTDLGNVRVMRLERASSKERVKPWAGIISTKRVESVPTHGKSITRAGINPAKLEGLKEEAHKLVGDIRVDYEALADKIGERILARL